MKKSQTKKYNECMEIESKLRTYPNVHLDEIYKRIHLDLFLVVNTGIIHTADPIFIREFKKCEETMVKIHSEISRRTANNIYIKADYEIKKLDIPEYNIAFFKRMKQIKNGEI